MPMPPGVLMPGMLPGTLPNLPPMLPNMMASAASRPNLPVGLQEVNVKKQRELYIGNLPTGQVSESMLRELFTQIVALVVLDLVVKHVTKLGALLCTTVRRQPRPAFTT